MALKHRLFDLWDRSFGWLLVAASLGVGLFFAAAAVRGAVDIHMAHVSGRDWKSTHAVVEKASLMPGCASGNFGARQSLRVDYVYEVAGQRYRNDRMGFGGDLCAGRADVEATLNKFPVGATMSVHYDPLRPASSVLYRGRVEIGAVLAVVLASVLSLIGLGWPIRLLQLRKRERTGAMRSDADLR